MARKTVIRSEPATPQVSAVSVDLIESFLRAKRAKNIAASTLTSYRADLNYFAKALAESDTDLAGVTRRHIETWLGDNLDAGLAAATVARRFRTLQQFFRWAAAEEEVTVDPTAKMAPPKVPVQPPPIISADDLARLLDACQTPRGGPGRATPTDGRATFENRRDAALIQLLATTGCRSSELMMLEVADVDMNNGTFTVMGKGRRARVVALMPKAADALDRYLRQRRRHQHAQLPALWLGVRGPLTNSGLRQLLERRCHDAGLEVINPHRFRHTFAHVAKSRGMQDGDLMAIAGWQSPQMLHRYGASAAAERARESHLRFFGNDG
jgi:site-specific recombinase XerD